MKVCLQCKRENPNDGVFCSYCGSKFATAPPPLLKPVDDTPREVLRFLLHKHPECINNPRLLKSFLSDYLAKAEADRFLLCLVAEKRIPERLQSADRISASLFGNLTDILTEQCCLQPELAQKGILIWAYALGKEVEAVLPPRLTSQDSSASSLKTQSNPNPRPNPNPKPKLTPKQQTKPAFSFSFPQVGQVLALALPKGIALELVWCPPGRFMMGSPEAEYGRQGGEAQHQVTLTKGFWIGKYAVTQEQYEAVTGSNPSVFKGARRPVGMVSWDEAKAFCARVQLPTDGSIPSGYRLTLPTEAQWEYACRAGTRSAFNDGSSMSGGFLGFGATDGSLGQLGWYYGNSGVETHIVGLKLPNAWGLYDMHGNVWEWCRDCYGSYSGAATDPIGPSTGSYRVIRGGSCYSVAERCRSAYRHYGPPSDRGGNLGLRPVLAPVQ